MVRARQLAQHERVEAIGLAARDAEARPRTVTWLGCKASTRNPASNSRSTSTPSGRSTATSRTFNRTNCRHNDRSPLSSCANVAASSFSPAASATSTSCFSDAQ
jgi:hypothetical protein